MAQCVAYGYYLHQKVSNMVLGFFPPYVYSAIPWTVLPSASAAVDRGAMEAAIDRAAKRGSVINPPRRVSQSVAQRVARFQQIAQSNVDRCLKK